MHNIDAGPVRQGSVALFGSQIQQRLEVLGAREWLMDAIDLCCEGRPMAARDAVESAVARIDDGGRRETGIIEALADYPPVCAIDLALHERREGFIKKLAQGVGWNLNWDGPNASATSEDGTGEFHVNSVDGWRCTSGMPDLEITGLGLVSLHAHIRGEDLVATVARLTPWFAKISKGRAA